MTFMQLFTEKTILLKYWKI